MIEIKLQGNQNIKGYTLLECLPGIGLVGPMAGSYIIQKLEMECIGYVQSEYFPPIASIHNNIPMFPARIYKSTKYKLVLFIAEFTVPPIAVYPLANEILSFARKYDVSKIVSVGGMPSQKRTDNIYLTSTDAGMIKKAVKVGIKPIRDGVVAGVSAALLVKSQEYNIPALEVLVEVDPNITNPKYAEVAIKGLNELLDMDIDLDELEKESKEVDAKIREMMKKVKDTHNDYAANAESTGPSMYA